MRPQTFNDIAGQCHLTGENSLFMKLVSGGDFDSIMLVGPPGTGKTSMARLIGNSLGLYFYQLHASTAGTGELKKIAETSSLNQKSLIFIDEIHRYNKSQQDILLKLIDDRAVKLIGASAENPYYNLVPALRSRSLIFNFKPVSADALEALAKRADDYFKERFDVDEIDKSEVFERFVLNSGGDVRRFLNLLELSALVGKRSGRRLILSSEGLLDIAPKRAFNEDEYYDILSAMIKSIRGTDPDAALLWGMKLVNNGVQPEDVFRRLMISASEDIGNAYPDAAIFVNSCFQSFTNVGAPEGLIILAHAITFLASCPKSNRSYLAYKQVVKYLDENDPQTPENVSHAAKGYKYPFDYGFFVKQDYTKEGLVFYNPTDNGFEVKIKERLSKLWNGTKKYG